ncbi:MULTISPECIES: rhodanese-like domain-containing protein [Streptomyces]|uniref:Rhodanese-like domain-containing protein n=1 Tax=Streptomyces sudanensis TaxID=436397 RepID=A0ABY4TJ06_9ACTN|nr:MULTISPECIES: rhodanese-like domain-containing protein [Streptomyces]MCP9960167.1 rhodanese-like domain-containing protein [Streptomyces sudanensis]MCP9999463.1 rhodanese-like domain-containing protein [Streptomyces sudanensis]URN18491.1 rhodanese-like domain-containing protein [Streptomyces sudanensis]
MTTTSLTPDQARARLHELTVVDVRTPGEHASGHLPGAHNVPLDRLDEALPALRAAAGRGDLLLVCASGNRSATACRRLAEHGVAAATLTGGTTAWAERGHEVHRPEGARAPWAMDRQVRLAAGSLVLAGLLAGRRLPRARLLSAGVAGGLVFSALTDTCGMARILAKLPHNRPRTAGLDATLAALAG